MIDTVKLEKSTWAKLPFKFEAGTPNIAGIIGMGEALRWMQDYDIDAMAAHELGLDWVGFEPIDLAGFRLSGGVNVTF